MEQNKVRIFIAEDEPLVLFGFQEMVREAGYEIAGTAMDGKSSVEQILRLRPDLILMDINMPLIDGITALETINQTARIPAIIVTGYRSNTYVERAVAANVYGYLQKPVDEFELRSGIRIALTQSEKARQAEQGKEMAERQLRERKVIERAKGMLMEQFGLTEPQAMKALQRKSADTNRKLYQVALDMLKLGE